MALKLMVFVDGENLVFRYQSMLAKGFKPFSGDGYVHIPDVFVWSDRISVQFGNYDILRCTYYTYATASIERITEINEQIHDSSFSLYRKDYARSRRLTPCVFKKEKRTAKAKGVDIQLTVDVLTHVYRQNVDTVFILTGDGDYEPLINEVSRCGKEVFLGAFSDGLNPRLPILADEFWNLDDEFFFQKES